MLDGRLTHKKPHTFLLKGLTLDSMSFGEAVEQCCGSSEVLKVLLRCMEAAVHGD